MGSRFWRGMEDWMEHVLGEEYITASDRDMLHITDDVDEAVQLIANHVPED